MLDSSKGDFVAYISGYLILLLALSPLPRCLSLRFSDDIRLEASTTQNNRRPPACFTRYFLHQSPPQGLLLLNPSSQRFICQSIPSSPDADFFATLFDDEAGIAIFSAHTVNYGQSKKIGKFPRENVSNIWRTDEDLPRQGSDKMYRGRGTGPKGFDKGHLNPVYINSFDKQHVLATFTYSNAVPQYSHFNRGPWKRYEEKIVHYVINQCAEKHGRSAVMYLLTGTSRFRLQARADKPTRDQNQFQIEYFPSAKAEDRIVRPNSMWTAGCCVWKEKSGKVRAQSIAVMGNNDFNKRRIGMRSLHLTELENLLVDAKSKRVDLFPSVEECRTNGYQL